MKHLAYILFLLLMAAIICLGAYFVLQGEEENKRVEAWRERLPLEEEGTQESAAFPWEGFPNA